MHSYCSLSMRWALQDEYILEAGLNNDIELPYTCRGGICGYVSAISCPPPPFRLNTCMPVHQQERSRIQHFNVKYCQEGRQSKQDRTRLACLLHLICRSCVGRVCEGEVDMSDVSHQLPSLTCAFLSNGQICLTHSASLAIACL